VKENAIEKRAAAPLREKGQYALVYGVIAAMLYAAGFPIFLLFFVGILTFFIWKVFSSENRHEVRRIFEFYLSANEILREDDRRWFGFEIQETIQRGEAVIRAMTTAPPLAHFALGALYQKLDDHSSAVKHLSDIIESSSTESAIVFPTKELREYVRMLRKIERAPAEAPLTSSAIRSLERMRKNKGASLLEYSRSQSTDNPPQLTEADQKAESVVDMASYRESEETRLTKSAIFEEVETPQERPLRFVSAIGGRKEKDHSPKSERQSISEVLHDIYDKNIQ
jgi:hypothetical protein